MSHARKLALLLSMIPLGCDGVGSPEGEQPPEASIQRIKQALSGGVTACDAARTPGPNQVAVFQHTSYGGNCFYLDMPPDNMSRGYEVGTTFGLGNDSLSSLKVGSNVFLTLFEDTWFGGRSGTYTSDKAALGWSNDLASSLRLTSRERNCWGRTLQQGEVAIFEDANFAGDCVLWKRGDDVGWGAGLFPFIDWDASFEENSASSIKVGPNTILVLYRETWFSDTTETYQHVFTSNAAQLSVSQIAGKSAFGNDKVSSFIIR